MLGTGRRNERSFNLLGDVGTQIDRREMSVFKLFTQLRQANSVVLRILSTVLLISIFALVYNQSVYAAETYMLKIYINGVDSSQTAVEFPVIGEQRRFQVGRHDGTWDFEGYNTLFDVCVPVTFIVDKYYSTSNFAVSVDLVPGFNLSCPTHDVIYSGFYIDDYDFVTGNAIVNSSASIKPGTSIPDGSNANIYVSVRLFDMPFRGVTSFTFNVHFLFTSMTASAAFPGESFLDSQKTAQSFTFSIKGLNNNLYFTSDNVTSNNSEIGKLQDIQDTIEQEHQEEIDKGESSGSDASDMVDDITNQVKSKWEILFYPIEFTKKFLALFTSSSSGSTVIEFPQFEMDIGGQSYKVWDSYSFDMSTLQSNFGVLFTGLHMVIGTIEVGAFIKYLYGKYDEVFGGGVSS